MELVPKVIVLLNTAVRIRTTDFSRCRYFSFCNTLSIDVKFTLHLFCNKILEQFAAQYRPRNNQFVVQVRSNHPLQQQCSSLEQILSQQPCLHLSTEKNRTIDNPHRRSTWRKNCEKDEHDFSIRLCTRNQLRKSRHGIKDEAINCHVVSH